MHARRDYLALRRRTHEALRSGAFDLVHAHFGYTAAVVADVCARSRTPLLVSYCGGDINGEEGRVARRTRSWIGSVVSRLAGFAAAAIIVKNTAMLERLPRVLRKRTEIIPTGRIGNDRPIEITDEVWQSTELKMVVLSRHHDPRTGDVEYRLTNINRAEPARELFTPPADYTILDAPPPPPPAPRRPE